MTRAIQPQHLKYLVFVALAGLLALALLLAFVVFQGAAQAVTFNVNSTGDASDANTGDGNCNDGTGSCTLRAAIEQAGSGDNISVPAGIYTLSPNPPKDTDGRREGSGRGWVRELQGRWPGVLG